MKKEILREIVDYLKYNTNYTKEEMLVIINPLKTEEQAREFLKWVKDQDPTMLYYYMSLKAREIAKENK